MTPHYHKRTLITGGAGFLGSHLVKHLLKKDHEILVIDNFATGRRENLLDVADRIQIVEGTIADQALVHRFFGEFRPTYVIHSAASYKDPNNWIDDIHTNVLGTIHVLRESLQVGVKRLIYFQTALCYGRPQQHPIRLTHPLAPFTSYSISKTAAEHYLHLSGLSYVSLRLANIYGAGLLSGPIPAFYRRLKSGQPCTLVDARRDFLEVGDFLDLMDRVLDDDRPAEGSFNVSSGTETSIEALFRSIAGRMKIPVEQPQIVSPGDDDVPSLLLDPSETEKVFAWKASVPLEVGLDRLIRWYETNGVDQAYTHLRVGKT